MPPDMDDPSQQEFGKKAFSKPCFSINQAALQLERKLKETYWVCCFSVNQHRSICNFPGGPRPDPVTKCTPALCGCTRQKYLKLGEDKADKGYDPEVYTHAIIHMYIYTYTM